MKSISIIGSGPSALLLASFLDETKFSITIYEKNNTTGRKFLVAGNGGFNLTHSEPIPKMIERYTPKSFLEKSLLHFTNIDLQNWLKSIGVETFTGSSKRIYPNKNIKPITVLNSILETLKTKKITIKYNHQWIGWDKDKSIQFKNGVNVKSDIIVYALGGGSWKITGSDGTWLDTFNKKGIDTLPFFPSNCGYKISWNPFFITKHEGKPLKNIALSCDNNSQKGELTITKQGLEGNAIYALSPIIRHQLKRSKEALIELDLKPNLTINTILEKINKSRQKNISTKLKQDLHLTSTQINLIKDTIPKEDYLNITKLAKHIKHLPLIIQGTDDLDKAISTVGGIAIKSVDDNFQLVNLRNQYCIGEMLDWDAPTGGYLLQGCFSMGVNLAKHLNSL